MSSLRLSTKQAFALAALIQEQPPKPVDIETSPDAKGYSAFAYIGKKCWRLTQDGRAKEERYP